MSREIRQDIRIETDETLIPSLPESMLKDPDYVFRWIRVKYDDEDDWGNITKREREGWEFLQAKDYPELGFPSQVRGAKLGSIGIGDLALARLPRYVSEARKAMVEKRATQQLQGIRAVLERNADSRMPLIDESKTQVGTGKQARFDT